MTTPRRAAGRPWLRSAVALSMLVAVATGSAGCGSSTRDTGRPSQRVLIVSLPGLTWQQLRAAELPNLDRLVRTSAVGDMSTRIGRYRASTTAAYLTVGSGTRAVVPGVDTGVALNPDELLAGIPAEEILRRRLGATPRGIAYIPVGAALEANRASPYGAVPGALGDRLAAAGVDRAVIANADAAEGFPADEPPPDGAYARSAATALMGSDGIVPGGSVGRELLRSDPAAPFGRRLDPAVVLAEFDRAWERPGRSVVLVEASDLSRAAAYGARADAAQTTRLRSEALADADAMVGELVSRTDPDRDAVVVMAPIAASGLGVAMVRAPDVSSGLLRSASTRRDGYVYLADVAPTVLELLGEEPPSSFEGRAFDVADADGNRVAHLADQAADAERRDDRLPVVVPVVIAALVVLTAIAQRSRRPGTQSRRAARAVRVVSIGALGIVPGTYLAGQVDVTRRGMGAYALVVLGIAGVVAVLGAVADRLGPGLGPLVGVGSVLGVLGTDIVVGAPLQVNTVFGYSMAVAGRFTGVGNLAFALFGAAAVAFAVLVHDRGGGRWLPVVVVVLAGVVALDGLPMLGADVGGVISLVPAFALTVWVLVGRRIGWRQVLASVVAGMGVVVVFALVDLARPRAGRTHLARLGEQLVDGRIATVDDLLVRRLYASFGDAETLVWAFVLVVVAAAFVSSVAVARGRIGPYLRLPSEPGSRGLAVGFGVLALLGLVANDSSIAVPATMLIVVVPVVLLRQRALADADTRGATAVGTASADAVAP